MGVRVVGIPVIDRHPIQAGAQVGLHALHQVPGVGAQVFELLRILGRDDEAELVAVALATLLEGGRVRLVGDGAIGTALSTLAVHAFALDVAQVLHGGAAAGLLQIHQPHLDRGPARKRRQRLAREAGCDMTAPQARTGGLAGGLAPPARDASGLARLAQHLGNEGVAALPGLAGPHAKTVIVTGISALAHDDVSREVMEKWDKEGRLDFPNSKDKNINRKIFLDEYKGQPINSLWTDIYVINPMSTERLEFTSGQKPEALLQRIITMVTKEGDIVLDYHLGSGTTCAVAHKMGRRWIGIEQMDYIEDITKERLKKVIEGEQGGISKAVGWQGGGSFVYFELKKYNQDFLDKIMIANSKGELDEVYNEMAKNAFLKFWFDKNEFEKDENFRSLDLDQRKELLIGILDENQLYLNYADMRDSRYHVTDEEMALTDLFYGVNND